jgi:hypothetical protein
MPPLTEWSVATARVNPCPSDFGVVLGELDRIRLEFDDEFLDETLPLRVATVALWNLHRGDLDDANRSGAAWIGMPTAMRRHEWKYRSENSELVVYGAENDFFDAYRHDVRALARLIDAIWEPPREGGWWSSIRSMRDNTERERAEDKEQTLKDELDRRAQPFLRAWPNYTRFGRTPRDRRRRRRDR